MISHKLTEVKKKKRMHVRVDMYTTAVAIIVILIITLVIIYASITFNCIYPNPFFFYTNVHHTFGRLNHGVNKMILESLKTN